MKTTILRITRKVFQGAAMLNLFILFLLSAVAHAQQPGILQPENHISQASGTLQGKIFPSLDPLILKVVFLNPEKESISLIVWNEDKEIVYRKVIGKTASFNGKFNFSGLQDGNYTLEIQANNHSLSRNFQISTQVARLTQMQ